MALCDATDKPVRCALARLCKPYKTAAAPLSAARSALHFGKPQVPVVAAIKNFPDRQKSDLAAPSARQLESGVAIKVAHLDCIEPAHQLSSASGIRV
jgi:hypothetical protein